MTSAAATPSGTPAEADGKGGTPGRAARVRRSLRRFGPIFGLIVGVIAVIVIGYAWLLTWTDHEWYASVGEDAVFWTRYASIWAVWGTSTALNFVALLLASRSAWAAVGAKGRFRAVTAVAAFAVAAAMGVTMSNNWMVFRLAWAQSPFGITDPQFGLDVGFFVFTLPALELVVGWGFQLVLLTMAVHVTIVFISSRLDYTGRIHADWWRVRRIFWRLLATLMVVAAASYVLRVWQLSYSTTQTAFVGASFTDVTVQLPGLIAMVVVCLVIAAVLAITSRQRNFRPAVWSFVGLIVMALLTSTLAPAAVQRFWTRPNEATLELPYLARNVEMTRLAYQLDQVSPQSHEGADTVPSADTSQVRDELSTAAVWSSSTVAQAFNQLQTIRPYYQLSSISTDRYRIDGRLEQVLVSAREISPSNLPSAGSSFVNRRLVYTHGYGLAISSASQTSKEGFPQFLVGDVPATVSSTVKDASSLRITQPRVYFGPDQSDWVVVNTGMDEFDYPSGTKNVKNRYAGSDGVTIGGPLNRLAWALRLRSVDLLVSGYVHDDSRILLNRGVVARASKIAPWLTYDTPYAAIVDGRITWIIDAYTTSDHFPYSQSLPNSSAFPNGTNYVRSSVKVTVDAETGQMHFYAVGADPVRDAWERIFPGVISHDTIPAALAAHLRVPLKLFAAQTQVFAKYHVSDPTVFYNQEDTWRIPSDASGKTLSPQYVLLDTSGTGTGLDLVQPYVLPNRDDLVGWLTASSEPDSYGAKTVFTLPKSRVILGAAQVSARINQDPDIAQQLTLWNQPGSTVTFGSMLVLPIRGSTVYLQPVFLTAQNNAITELVGVVAVNGSTITLGSTLPDALARAFPDKGVAGG
ncbi:UPF0182 family protein [Propionicimonas sp.]|uniref:UPF0182 family protein n=1 Tax=Propionicimonas sp. TaxID=1955623 RepID=UPI0039E41F45